ncbi:nuclear transport factor 2 family protein [Niabella hibiscisoli]|uniref:nuclear transport factor 2 family protein n=1 Tax=Niabella hibiscisoli TaxID=1825928 RepID=UPI001F0FEB7F|nr:nuclear transport factor 2 family protein [Niabella hibiscisoli]MCH5719087.1 nuclear transport factor 2 family protein [Niabella hibiscisoli]
MDNKEILLRANAEIDKGNYEGFLEYCTDDTRWIFVGEQTLQGKAAVLKYMKDAYLQPPRVTVENFVVEGDYLIVYGTIALLNEAQNWVDYGYCDAWRLEDGKLAELKAYVVPL